MPLSNFSQGTLNRLFSPSGEQIQELRKFFLQKDMINIGCKILTILNRTIKINMGL